MLSKRSDSTKGLVYEKAAVMRKTLQKMWRWFREAETLDGLLGWWFTKFIGGGLVFGITFVTGWLENVPFAYLWVGGIAATYFTVSGLIRIDDWRRVGTVKGRLRSRGYQLSYNQSENDVFHWETCQAMIQIENISDQTIAFEVLSVSAILNDRTVQDLGDLVMGKRLLVAPHADVTLGLKHIPVDFKGPGRLDGLIDIAISYGPENKEPKFLYRRKYSITSFVKMDGSVSTTGLEQEAPLPKVLTA